jgi:hypothetical protein
MENKGSINRKLVAPFFIMQGEGFSIYELDCPY